MANDIKLQSKAGTHPLNENLRPLKVGDKTTPLELSNTDVRVNNLTVSGTTIGVSATDDTKLPLAGGTMTGDITTDSDIISTGGTFIIDSSGDIMLSAAGNDVTFTTDGLDERFAKLTKSGSSETFTLYSPDTLTDSFIIGCFADGLTKIYTADSDGAEGHLLFIINGHVEFDNCAVGFDKLAGTFSTSGVIGDGGHSTDIDFRLGNKYELELTDNMGATDLLNLIFPATSGNFLLVISQDGTGSRTVHADSWVAYQSDGSTKATNAAFANGTDGDIRFSGGSAPTLTTTADVQDIVSIYWDADNQTAFAVASLNFS